MSIARSAAKRAIVSTQIPIRTAKTPNPIVGIDDRKVILSKTSERERLFLAAALLQADDTPVPYEDPTRKDKPSQGYPWAYTKP